MGILRVPKAGDKVRVERYMFGYFDGFEIFELCDFHYCLGIWQSEDHKKAHRFTPLCELITPSPESKKGYISNFGEYNSEYIATYQIIQG